MTLREKRGYWKVNEEALDHTLFRTRFGSGYGPVVKAHYVNERVVLMYIGPCIIVIVEE